MTTLLLDADIFAYIAAASTEKAYFFDGPDAPPAKSTDLAGAIDQARDSIDEIKDKLGAADVIVCMSDPTSRYFRHDIYPDYKSKRGVKPETLSDVKAWLAETYKTYQRPGLEADDCMGILSTHPTLIAGDKIIVSGDKDMRTIPGLLYNPRTAKKVEKISRLAADRFHMTQTIVGDTCDGYPGAPGIGPKSPFVASVQKAKSAGSMWQAVCEAFERARVKAGPLDRMWHHSAEHAATEQARLARILRASDWDFKARKPILWSPPVKTAA